jgi:hypothetical protein
VQKYEQKRRRSIIDFIVRVVFLKTSFRNTGEITARKLVVPCCKLAHEADQFYRGRALRMSYIYKAIIIFGAEGKGRASDECIGQRLD